MNISYDPIADAMYIYLSPNKKSTLTEEVRDDFLIDFNRNKLIGMEILDVSSKMPKKELEDVTLSMPTYKITKLLK
jgi:uncharacterized protein YuzE